MPNEEHGLTAARAFGRSVGLDIVAVGKPRSALAPLRGGQLELTRKIAEIAAVARQFLAA